MEKVKIDRHKQSFDLKLSMTLAEYDVLVLVLKRYRQNNKMPKTKRLVAEDLLDLMEYQHHKQYGGKNDG